MPKIIAKQKIGSKGSFVQYGSGSSAGEYFYRELIPGTKNYKTKKIEGATSLEDAVAKAFDVATDLAREPDFDRPDAGGYRGNTYIDSGTGNECWLCGVNQVLFGEVPETIHVKVEPQTKNP